MKLLTGDKPEQAKRKALASLATTYDHNPETADLFIEAVKEILDQHRVAPSTLVMLQMLAKDERPEVVNAAVGLLSRGVAEGDASDCIAMMARMLGTFDRPEVAVVLATRLRQDLAGGKASAVTVAVIDALGSLSSTEAVEALTGALSAGDGRVVIVAAENLSRQQRPETFTQIVRLLTRPEFKNSYGFRRAVLVAISRYHTRAALDVLIEELPELDGQLKHEVVDYLARVLQQTFGPDADRWAAWWKEHRDSFEFPQSLPQAVPPYGWDYRAPEFYGYKVYAKRVIFVLDISTSMAKPAQRGGTKLDTAKQELRQAIWDLPPDATFNVIAFARGVTVWQAESMQATVHTKQAAIAVVNGLANVKGPALTRTALYDGLEAAFRVDANAEAIYLLSDGKPNCGKITDPAEILRVITAANRFRQVTINTIAVGRDSELLRQLAGHNNGMYRHSP